MKARTILGVSGSLRAKSSNTALLRAMVPLVPAGWEIVLAEPLDRLPHFNPDLEEPSPPEAVLRWRAALEGAEAVYICSPEYAHGVPGVLKNALDWDVSVGKFHRKPVALINASPNHGGAAKARASLMQTLSAMSAKLINQAFVSVAAVSKKIDERGNLTDPETVRVLRESVEALVSSLSKKSPA